MLDITLNENRFTLACLYAPNQDNPDFFDKVIYEIESIPNDNRIVGGDYNLVINELGIDKKGGNINTNKKFDCFINLKS